MSRPLRRAAYDSTIKPYSSELDHSCPLKCPCGGKCILRADRRHFFHTCRNEHCQHCHGDKRFRRGREEMPA
jgi:hypothetical protein